jgi:hypothetical protein
VFRSSAGGGVSLAYVLDRRGKYMDVFARMIDDNFAMLEFLFRISYNIFKAGVWIEQVVMLVQYIDFGRIFVMEIGFDSQ